MYVPCCLALLTVSDFGDTEGSIGQILSLAYVDTCEKGQMRSESQEEKCIPLPWANFITCEHEKREGGCHANIWVQSHCTKTCTADSRGKEKHKQGLLTKQDMPERKKGTYECGGTVDGVRSASWRQYLLKLYRVSNPARDMQLLPRIQEVDIIYRTNPTQHKESWFGWRRRLDVSTTGGLRLEMPFVADVPCCPANSSTPFTFLAPHAIVDAVWFSRQVPFDAYGSNTWVEVTHCGGSKFETIGAWFYIVRGSGLYVSTGKTIVFARHPDAAKYFLKRGCPNDIHECSDEIPDFTRAAHAAGYDSIQFSSHCDGRCETCGHELLLTYTVGTEACPPNVTFRAGINASQPCRCEGTTALRSDRGNCAACAGV
jgi:hypothetical protein